ncbi:hypothetical protein [Microbacterium lacus]|uniref:hypothetical protein n=1 Tax=Microbacterium lacus TaxID=415217 RepID=UPI000C2B730B|nr:hypothetical protein [Microbacterium lacus]
MTPQAPSGNDAELDERDADPTRGDAELRELRLRAYGPDADIESDPAALARLRELEGVRRAVPAASSPGTASAATSGPSGSSVPPRPPLPVSPLVAGEPGSLPVDDRNSDASAAAMAATPASAPATPGDASTPRARSWARRLARWSRNPRAIAVAAVALVVVLALAIVPGLFTDRPDALLRVDPGYADEQLSTEYRLFLRQIGADMDDFMRFEDFAGLQVWGTPTDAPVRCVLVSDGPQDVRALSCIPRGLDPVADMMVYPGSPVPGDLEERYPDAGAGTAVRFTLSGDSVEVRVVLADSELELS